MGILAAAADGEVVINSNSVVTSGDGATGIFAGVFPTDSNITITSGDVATSGYYAMGVAAVSYADVAITSTGTVTTAGERSIGLLAAGYSNSTIVNSGTVTTAGDLADGVYAISETGDAVVVSNAVTVTGADANAIFAESITGDVTVDVTGATSSALGYGVTATASDAVNITVAAGGSVVGETAGIFASSTLGTTINLAGSVSSTGGYAIQVQGAAATINNTGNTIFGAVSLTAGDDVLNNSGSWFAIGDSDFGLGDDLLSNTGLIEIVGAGAPVVVTFNGLETIDNAGLIDMANGTTGDVFDLSSATFNGLTGGELMIDVDGTDADLLIIADATGVTPVTINNVGTGGIGVSAVFVQSGSVETGDEFVINDAQVTGFVDYDITFDDAALTYMIVGGASPRVLEPLRFVTGAQNVWHKGGDAWSARMDDLRDAGDARPDGLEMWAQVFAGGEEQTTDPRTFSAFGSPVTADLSWEQEHQGFQTGFDLRNGGALWGLTTGMMTSSMRLDAGSSADYAGFNVGAYGAWTAGRFFINGLVKADVYEVEALMPTVPLYESFDGTTWGARIEAGARMGGDRGWFIEPVTRLSWVSADLDGFSGQGASFEFDEGRSLRGEAGLRIGTTHVAGSGLILTPHLGLFAVDEFEGENAMTVRAGALSDRFVDLPTGGYGRADFGVAAVTPGGLEAFVEGEALFGGDEAEGLTARMGVRWRW